jgi:hypothetical protein
MKITVYDENGKSIPAVLISYNSALQELQRDNIPAGGADYARPGEATHWVFQAPGYQDAARNDLLNYDSFDEELIPKYNWLAPALLGLAAYWLIIRSL